MDTQAKALANAQSTRSSLRAWQDELAAVPFALGVIVEEIAVETRLNEAANPADIGDVTLGEIAKNPIQDVEGSVRAHAANEVRGQIFYFSTLLHEHQLWDDGYALEPDRH